MGCNTTNSVSFGSPGKNGTSAYIYVAYADDVTPGTPDTVSNFNYGTPLSTSKWIAIKNSTLQLSAPVETDFEDLWIKVAGVGLNPDTNIYNTDGVLEGNRTIDADGHSLSLTNLNALIVNGLIYPIADGATGQALVTDGAGNLVFYDIPTLYSADGSLNGARTITGGGYSLDILNLGSFSLTSNADITLTNNSGSHTSMVLSEDLIQFNANGGDFYSYGNKFRVLANELFQIDGAVNSRIGTSDAGVNSRITFDNGYMYLDATNQIHIYLNGSLIYKLPTTMPTTGQVLTAADNAGTLAWV